MRIVVATSLSPRGPDDVQRRAVDSWRQLDLAVASFNLPAEIEQLRPRFPDVDFVPLAHDGSAACGRPLANLPEIFAHLGRCGAGVVGLINSDIVLRDISRTALAEAASGAMVAGARLDVASLDAVDDGEQVWGFDAFFMPPAFLDVVSGGTFYLGMPYWDYWLPATTLLRGRPVLITDPPVAWHRKHDTAWGEGALRFNAMFVAVLLDEMEKGAAAADRLARPERLAVDILRFHQQRILARAMGDRAGLDEREEFHVIVQLREFGDYFAEAVRYFIELKGGRVDLFRGR